MVITNLIGGLGNQMFQYAVGRAHSLRKGADLALDISGFENYELHQGFELQRVFAGSFRIASSSEIKELLGWQSSSSLRRILIRRPFAAFRSRHFVIEPHFWYWPGINALDKDCYLTGYWQSERYFADFSAQIRADFTFQQIMEGENAELAGRISEVDAVSLHVRRGDYASNSTTTAMHGLCSLNYYRGAIQLIAGRVQQPHFFIFSDDIEWVRKNLDVGFPCTYVQHNRGIDSFNDMRLMSLCKHNIIANSSFSWWGAWLNPSLNKIVIAPKKWFANSTPTDDLIPSGWIRC